MRRMWIAALLLASLLGACTSAAPDRGMSLLYEINANVNRSVTYVAETAGRNEWKVAESEGDCEDIAIRKRRDLVDAGFPAERLSVLVVPGHAVLLARTTSGDYVLDSRTDRISTWSGAGREYMPMGDKWLPRDYVLAAAQNTFAMVANAR